MVSLKIRCGDDIRRISIEKDTKFQDIVLQLRKLLHVGEDEDLILKYLDDEGDKICLSSDLEFREALQCCKEPIQIYVVKCQKGLDLSKSSLENVDVAFSTLKLVAEKTKSKETEEAKQKREDEIKRELSLKMEEEKRRVEEFKKQEALKLKAQMDAERLRLEQEQKRREEEKIIELKKIEEEKRRQEEEKKKQEELKRLEERRIQELKRIEEEKKKEEEKRRQEELKRIEEEKKKEEEKRMQEKRKIEEEIKENLKRLEEQRMQDLKRIEEERKRQEEFNKLEERRAQEFKRIEEEKKKEEEKRRQEELKRIEEERKKQEELKRIEEEKKKEGERSKRRVLNDNGQRKPVKPVSNKTWSEYKARNNRVVLLDMSMEALQKFGVHCYQRVNTPVGPGTVIGVDQDHGFLWFQLDKDGKDGISYWDDILNYDNLICKGIFPLEETATANNIIPLPKSSQMLLDGIVNADEKATMLRVIQESLVDQKQMEIKAYYRSLTEEKFN